MVSGEIFGTYGRYLSEFIARRADAERPIIVPKTFSGSANLPDQPRVTCSWEIKALLPFQLYIEVRFKTSAHPKPYHVVLDWTPPRRVVHVLVHDLDWLFLTLPLKPDSLKKAFFDLLGEKVPSEFIDAVIKAAQHVGKSGKAMSRGK